MSRRYYRPSLSTVRSITHDITSLYYIFLPLPHNAENSTCLPIAHVYYYNYFITATRKHKTRYEVCYTCYYNTSTSLSKVYISVTVDRIIIGSSVHAHITPTIIPDGSRALVDDDGLRRTLRMNVVYVESFGIGIPDLLLVFPKTPRAYFTHSEMFPSNFLIFYTVIVYNGT